MTNPFIIYYENGNKHIEEYRVDGKQHRDPLEGPSFISYYSDGIKAFENYAVHNKLHNPYGPAWIDIDSKRHKEWWLNGIHYTDEVNEYLDKHNLIWQNMTQTDFDIMWTCIL